jgi:hypothetical protein
MGSVSAFYAYGKKSLWFLPVNPAVILWFKFLLLLGIERILIYGNLKRIDDLTVHRGRQVWKIKDSFRVIRQKIN